MIKLVWRNRARHDVRRIIEHIGLDDPHAATRLADLIETTAQRLMRHPRLHRPGRVEDTREAVLHPNYLLIYRIKDDAVEVLAIVHARQRYP